jgi:hypothetical protein
MRLLIHLLCVMLSVSFVLGPLSRMHAHVADEPFQQADVHGGHSHDGDANVPEHDANGTVVSLQSDSSQGAFQAWKPMHWISVLFVFAVMVLALRLLASIPRPSRKRTRPPSPYPHALPLLRGPPVSI